LVQNLYNSFSLVQNLYSWFESWR